MGWTSYRATYYKKNDEVDRKAECDSYFEEGLNRGHFKVLKSVMRGSTYYAAVKNLVRNAGVDEDGENIFIPVEDGKVWAAVFLTSVNNREYCNFSYKDMDETCLPYYFECPESILKLLTPTENKNAIEWRKKCRYIAKKKKIFSSLPVGSKIKFTRAGREYQCILCPPGYQFKRPFWMDLSGKYYVPRKSIPMDGFEVITPEDD